MQIIKVKSYNEMSALAAKLIAEQIKSKPDCVLGLATGATPIGTYEKLVEMHKKGDVDFSRVSTFNLDEYCGLERAHPQSYYHFMAEKLFNFVFNTKIKDKNVNFLNGATTDPQKECEEYEKLIREKGIDLQLLGVGTNGHIGFNEPDDVFHNNTRYVKLAQSTIESNAHFFDNAGDVPKTALSMGIGTIMSAKKIILIASANKSHVIDKLQKETVVSPQFPVSILQYHPDCTIIFFV